ncbi:MAG TPA: gluconokinase [Burkholderia sp.]|nr:gluconokinase [Burkholderia sp.]
MMNETVSAIVVMGVAGCGKSSVASGIAARIGARFIEGDAFHPVANVEKMRRGVGLVDADRWGWLDTLAAELNEARTRGEPVVLACSALKRDYRDRLRGGDATVHFVYLALPEDEALKRVGSRPGHFMPATLVASQFADLEAPVGEMSTLAVDATLPLDGVVDEAVTWHLRTCAGQFALAA